MKKAFIITGLRDGKEINGVFFTTTDPAPAFFHKYGLENIEVFHVSPKSAYPLEPALYLFRPGSNEVEIIGFNWCHEELARAKAAGAPYHLIPPVGGEPAEKTRAAQHAARGASHHGRRGHRACAENRRRGVERSAVRTGDGITDLDADRGCTRLVHDPCCRAAETAAVHRRGAGYLQRPGAGSAARAHR